MDDDMDSLNNINEEEEDEEESSSDDDRRQMMQEAAKSLRAKRTQRTQRPSTIVQVNTGALEIHLRQMKKQLQRHETEISHPTWLDQIMEDLNKIPGLIRKIEHCQLDINNVRELLNKSPAHSSQENDVDKIKQLFADIEALRLVVRRIDLHNALEASMFAKVSEIQKQVKGLMKEKRDGGANMVELIKLQDSLEGQIKSIVSRLDDADDNAANQNKYLMNKVMETEKLVHRSLDETSSTGTQKLNDLKQATNASIREAVTELNEQLTQAMITSTRATKIAFSLPLKRGVEHLQAFVRQREIYLLRRAYRSWQEFDPIGLLRRGRRVLQLLSHAGQGFVLKKAFVEWIHFHKLQCRREKLRLHIRNLVFMWEQNSRPSLGPFFRFWKRKVILQKFKESCEGMSVSGDPEVDKSDSSIYTHNNPPNRVCDEIKSLSHAVSTPLDILQETSECYGSLMSRLNIKKDPVGCIELIGLYIDSIKHKFHEYESEKETASNRVAAITETVERNRHQLSNMITSRCETIESTHNYHKKAVSAHLVRLKEEWAERDGRSSEQFTVINDRIGRLEGNVSDILEKVETQTSRLERLYSLHGTMLERLEKLEQTQTTSCATLKELCESVKDIQDKSELDETKFTDTKQQLEDAMEHLNSELSSCRSASRHAMNKLEAVVGDQKKQAKLVAHVTAETTEKLSQIEKWVNTTAPMPPSPEQVVHLCLSFEDKAVQMHSRGQEAMHLSMSMELAVDIAKCTHWLARHVVDSTDIDVLTKVMRGSQPQQPFQDTDEFNSSENGDQQTISVTHEEFCNVNRERFLVHFFDEFHKELDQLRPDAGIVRKEARACFLNRFIDALDLAIGKLDAIVLGTSSSLGRNAAAVSGRPSSRGATPACMACDRPLRMRVTSNPLGQLRSRIQQHLQTSDSTKRQNMRKSASAAEVYHDPNNSVSEELLASKLDEYARNGGDGAMSTTHSTSALANDLRKLCDSEAGSHSTSSRRPMSAGVLRRRHNNYGASNNDSASAKFVKKSGFKMRIANTMPQNQLVESLSSNLSKESTISRSHELHLPSPDVQRLEKVSGLE